MHLVVGSTTMWYAARAGGVVAYLLVSASVLAGILLAGKASVPGLPRFAVEDVHRFLGLLAGLFIAVHVGSVALDTVVPFSLTQLVIPFTLELPPARDRPRRRRGGAARRRGGDEPAALAPAVPRLASRALRDARRVAARHRPRHPQRHRPQPDLAAGGVRARPSRWSRGRSCCASAAPPPRDGSPSGSPSRPARARRARALGAARSGVELEEHHDDGRPRRRSPDLSGNLTGTIEQDDDSGIVSISGTAAAQSPSGSTSSRATARSPTARCSCSSRAARRVRER